MNRAAWAAERSRLSAGVSIACRIARAHPTGSSGANEGAPSPAISTRLSAGILALPREGLARAVLRAPGSRNPRSSKASRRTRRARRGRAARGRRTGLGTGRARSPAGRARARAADRPRDPSRLRRAGGEATAGPRRARARPRRGSSLRRWPTYRYRRVAAGFPRQRLEVVGGVRHDPDLCGIDPESFGAPFRTASLTVTIRAARRTAAVSGSPRRASSRAARIRAAGAAGRGS